MNAKAHWKPGQSPGTVGEVLDEDWVCTHAADALEIIAREGHHPLAGVVVCRDCGAELRLWIGQDGFRQVAVGASVADVLKYRGP